MSYIENQRSFKMYHFVTPDAEGLAQRRQLLDLYANIAQWSTSVPLIAVQTVLLLRYLQRKYSSESSQRYAAVARSQEESGTSGSLSLKHEGEPGSNKRPWSFKTAWNSFMWWNGEEVELAESSRGALLAAACWATWLLALSVAQTGDGESEAVQSPLSRRKGSMGDGSDVRACQIIFTLPNVSASSRRHRCLYTICSP